MEKILDKVGEDLVTLVVGQGLPTTGLNIDIPRVNGFRFFDYLLITLARQMNSALLVGNDMSYLKAYINALALLMSHSDKLTQAISACEERLRDDSLSMSMGAKMTQRLVGKRLYGFHMDKFLSLGSGQGKEVWNTLFQQLIEETREQGYILVIDDIATLFKEANRDKFEIPALHLFFATRGIASLTFIAPLVWPDYVHDIEHGQILGIVRSCEPLLLTPRPKELPPAPIERIAPDQNFDFAPPSNVNN